MRFFSKENIIILILGVLLINSFIPFGDVGMSEDEHKLRLKIYNLEQDNILLNKKNSQIEVKIKKFKDEIIKNDSIIDDYNISQIDSMFSKYFDKKR